MNNPFSRPLFRGNFLQHYAEGGIVSTVAGPEETAQDPMQIMQGMADQVDQTERNLDAAGSLDEILSSFTGEPTTAADARMKLGALVGERDAEQTPDSVLALVQPAMAIMEMSRQMQPEGGIQQAPFNDAEGMPMEAGMPPVNFQQGLPAFADGGPVNMDAIMAKYAALEGKIPQGYASDPTSAWMALAQVGAGIASGPTFGEGLAKGTTMAGPYMQAGVENVNRQKSALQAFVANEAQNQEQNNFAAAQADKQIAAQIAEGEKDRNMQWQIASIRTDQDTADIKIVDEIMATSGLPEGSPEYAQMRGELLKKALEGKGGTTINMGDRADSDLVKSQIKTEETVVQEVRTNAATARKTLQAIAPVQAMLEDIRLGKDPAFTTGGAGAPRLAFGQAINFLNSNYDLGLDQDTINKFIGGDPKAGEVLQASMAKLRTVAAENLSRATNLQVTTLAESFPNLSNTPQGNLMIADILAKSAKRDLEIAQYSEILRRTYGGTLSPATMPKEYRDQKLADAGVTAFNGYETGKPFDENGKPIMSLDEYQDWLESSSPLMSTEDRAQLKALNDTAPSSINEAKPLWDQFWNSGVEKAKGNEQWAKLPQGTVFLDGGKVWTMLPDGARVLAPPEVADKHLKSGGAQ
jgi:hypothetical protein